MKRRRKVPFTKSQVMKKHFQVRCLQRLGYLVSHDDLVKLIQNNNLELIRKQSNRVSIYRWTSKEGTPMQVVYDKNRKQIVTVLYDKEDYYDTCGQNEEQADDSLFESNEQMQP